MAIFRGAGGPGDATTDAANEASVASTKAAEAEASATAAASSANSASNSASSATNSKDAAATSESNAFGSASAAATSETNAATSETNAATSETNAATSETNASNSAAAALSSKNAAAISEANAATSETNAATSETNAAASETNAAASYDSFDDRYLGAKSTDPTVDNDGDILITGALYFNTTSNDMKVYNGSAWVVTFATLAGALIVANNLSDVSSADASRTNLGLAIGTDVQAHSAVLDATTASYTTAEETKLSGIETAATADQTAGEIKTAYESNADTNAFTDAEQTKLSGIETSATADQTGAEIKAAYEIEANAFTDAQFTKLAGIEASATADQSAAEIKTAYESNADTNAFTDADHTKLDGIEASADVTDATNVTAAGALMDSEVTNLAQVKAFDTTDYATAAQGTLADSAIQTGDSPSFAGLTVDTDTLAVDSTNNRVGIGTASPSQKLVVNGTDARIYLSGANTDIDMDSVSSGQLSLDGNGYAFGIALNSSGANLYTNAVSRNLIFGVDETEVMRITNNSVGIGTASPSTPLEVVGTVRVTNTVNASNNSNIRDGGGLVVESGNSNPLYFYTGGSEQMRIDSAGDVLINTTTLGVQSADAISTDSSVGRLYLNTTGTSGLLFLNQSYNDAIARYQILFYRRESVVGSITSTTSTTAYNTTSDYRLKENLNAISNGIDRVKQLNPLRFNFIANPEETVDGFLAHEVDSIVPEAITGEKDALDENGNIDPQQIDQSKLVPLLTSALQEAITKIEALEARVATLENN